MPHTTSKYQSKSIRLKERVQQDILGRVFQLGETLPPDTELATRYQAGRATIRRTLLDLQNEGWLVKNEKRGYTVKLTEPHLTHDEAATSAVTRNYSFAAFCHYPPGGWEVEVYNGIAQYAGECGTPVYRLHYDSCDEAARLLMALPDTDAKGAIVLPLSSPSFDAALTALAQQNYPVVCLDRPAPNNLAIPSIEVDNFSGVYLGVTTLIKRFRKRAFYLGLSLDSETAHARYAGYCQAMFDSGFSDQIEECSILVKVPEADAESWSEHQRVRLIKNAAKNLIRRGKAPILIACLNDHTAFGVYAAAAEMNMLIGKDIMLLGFDDLPLAECLTPRLSSIRQPRALIGYEAAKLLDRMINGPALPAMRKILPVELVERESTGSTETQL